MASVARYCCCDAGPCPSIKVTVTGVDATECPVCIENRYELASALAVDGVYTNVTVITFESTAQCFKESSAVVFSTSIKRYNSTPCTGTESNTSPQTGDFKIFVTLASADSGVTWSLSSVAINDENGSFGEFFRAFSWSGSQALPATVSNQGDCASGGFFISLANGGTVTVELA